MVLSLTEQTGAARPESERESEIVLETENE